MHDFKQAHDQQPFTLEAWRKVSSICIPKRSDARLNAINKVSVAVQLPSHVKELCDQLRKDPSKISIEKIVRGEAISDISLQCLSSTCLGALRAAEEAQLYDVVESILCLTLYWHGLECAKDPKRITTRLSALGLRERTVEAVECFQQLSFRGQKIFTFCSEFLQDIGTVFHLPREAKV